jgi:hypothetical protein
MERDGNGRAGLWLERKMVSVLLFSLHSHLYCLFKQCFIQGPSLIMFSLQRLGLLFSTGGHPGLEERHCPEGLRLLEASGCSPMDSEVRHRNRVLLELPLCHKGDHF